MAKEKTTSWTISAISTRVSGGRRCRKPRAGAKPVLRDVKDGRPTGVLHGPSNTPFPLRIEHVLNQLIDR